MNQHTQQSGVNARYDTIRPDVSRTQAFRDAAVLRSAHDPDDEESCQAEIKTFCFGSLELQLQHIPGHASMSLHSMGLHLWPSAEVLCDYMMRKKFFARHRTICELGAGTGCCGLLNAHLYGGASSGRVVALTDGALVCCQQIAENIGLNMDDQEVHLCRLRWGEKQDHVQLPLQVFDAVIASDCAFSHDATVALMQSLDWLLPENRGTFVTSIPTRNISAMEVLVEIARKQGLSLIEPSMDPAEVLEKARAAGHRAIVLHFEKQRLNLSDMD